MERERGRRPHLRLEKILLGPIGCWLQAGEKQYVTFANVSVWKMFTCGREARFVRKAL